MGLIHDPNTRQWKPGDLVIHDSDAKRTDMLMIVLGQDASGVFRTRYAYPWVQARPWRRKIWRNTVEWIHDPAPAAEVRGCVRRRSRRKSGAMECQVC